MLSFSFFINNQLMVICFAILDFCIAFSVNAIKSTPEICVTDIMNAFKNKTYMNMYIHTYLRTHIHTHTHIYIYIYIYIYTYI